MQYSAPTDGFRLAYERSGSGAPVVLLHGWPGDHTDWDQLVPGITDIGDVLTPDLRGFGQSDKHEADPEEIYSGRGQARAVVALMNELGLKNAVVACYDVGSFVGQTVATIRPDLVKALVVSPPLPGAGQRVLELGSVKEFWYTSFHQLDLVQQLIDGNRDPVRAYIHHFWSHWSGPNYIVDEKRIDHLADVYSAPGAFIASINWYRSSGNPVTAYAAETKPSARQAPCNADDDTLAGPGCDLSLSVVRPARRLLPGLHLGKIGWDRAFYPARGDGSIRRSHQAAPHELILPSVVSALGCGAIVHGSCGSMTCRSTASSPARF